MTNQFIFLLFAGIYDDDDSAFINEIYEKYYAMMIRRALEYVKNKSDAEDIVQNVFEQLIKTKKIPLLKTFECCILINYLVSTVRNTSINFINSRGGNIGFIPLTEDNEETCEFGLNIETPEKIFFDKNKRERIHGAIKKLPEKYIIIIECKYLHYMSDKDIAAKLNIKPDSVREYLTRARRELYKILKQEYDLV